MVPREVEEPREHDHYGCSHAEGQSSEESHPGLFGRDILGELAFALTEELAHGVGSDIGAPDEYEEAEQQPGVELPSFEGDEVRQCQRQHYVQQAREDVGHVARMRTVLGEHCADRQGHQQNDGQSHVLNLQPPVEICEQKGEFGHSRADGDGLGAGMAFAHGHAVELQHHGHHHEQHQSREQILVDEQAAQHHRYEAYSRYGSESKVTHFRRHFPCFLPPWGRVCVPGRRRRSLPSRAAVQPPG